MNKNSAYILAVITETNKEYVMIEGIKRPIIKAKCCDKNGELSEIQLIFSEIYQIRKSTGLNIGDVIYFSATVGECPCDNLMFYPSNIHMIRKNNLPKEEGELEECSLKGNISPFMQEKNTVLLEGVVLSTTETSVCISVLRPEFLRGEVEQTSHIWVNANPKNIEKGDFALFVGEISHSELIGDIYKN